MLEWFSVPELERRKQTVFPLNVDLETAGKLPPTVIQVSGADPLRDDGVVFRNILAAAGTDVLFFHYKVTCAILWALDIFVLTCNRGCHTDFIRISLLPPSKQKRICKPRSGHFTIAQSENYEMISKKGNERAIAWI